MLKQIIGSTLVLATLATMMSQPVYATQNSNSQPDQTTKEKLEKEGYTCGSAGVGFLICTKGNSKYWCEMPENICIPAPFNIKPTPTPWRNRIMAQSPTMKIVAPRTTPTPTPTVQAQKAAP